MGTRSILGFFNFLLTSECVQRSLDATAQKEELGCHGDQEAARSSVLVPKQTLQCGVVNFGKGQELCHPASLCAHRQDFNSWLVATSAKIFCKGHLPAEPKHAFFLNVKQLTDI